MSLLEVKNAVVKFGSGETEVTAVNDVSLSIEPSECLALVGESGCGKTTLARAILGLQPLNSGTIAFHGQQISGVQRELAKQVGMIWQDPYASLDPRWTVERSMLEPATLCGVSVDAKKMFETVGLDYALHDRYPHQLSGGQRQRVAIGRALVLNPSLVVCDEPTAALDLSVQAQILNLLKALQSEFKGAYLYISHDLMTVRFISQRVAVMKSGKIVELGKTQDIFESPQHPYTQELLKAAPMVEVGKR